MFWSCAIVACVLFVGIMAQQFANKVVLVTGGSSGIGKATSL
jgi:FlaA1/EpsC-like NDP-sugar epimerase